MRIPPYYKRTGWQRFFAGIIIGMMIGWFFFIYEFGSVQEKLVTEIKKKETIIEELRKDVQFFRSNQEALNKENQKKITVQEIKIFLKNDKEFKLNELSKHELKVAIENELMSIKNKNLETVTKAKELLFQTLENKVYVVNDKRYQITVKELYATPTLELFVEIRLAE